MMNVNEKISKKISNFLLESENTVSNVKIEYFFEMLLSEMEKLFIIAAIAVLANQTKGYMAVLMVVILVRKYCGGNHFKSSLICLVYSSIFFFIAIFLGNILKIFYVYELLVSLLMILFMWMAAPVKSDMRPLLRREDVIIIKVKGNIGIVIVNAVYFLASEKVRSTIFIALLLLLIDGMVAAERKGFYGLGKR